MDGISEGVLGLPHLLRERFEEEALSNDAVQHLGIVKGDLASIIEGAEGELAAFVTDQVEHRRYMIVQDREELIVSFLKIRLIEPDDPGLSVNKSVQVVNDHSGKRRYRQKPVFMAEHVTAIRFVCTLESNQHPLRVFDLLLRNGDNLAD